MSAMATAPTRLASSVAMLASSPGSRPLLGAARGSEDAADEFGSEVVRGG